LPKQRGQKAWGIVDPGLSFVKVKKKVELVDLEDTVQNGEIGKKPGDTDGEVYEREEHP